MVNLYFLIGDLPIYLLTFSLAVYLTFPFMPVWFPEQVE